MTTTSPKRLPIASSPAAGSPPGDHWRSLGEKRGVPQAPAAERAILAEKDAPEVGRRTFISLSSATAAVVGLNGCIRRPAEEILPFSQAPEYVVPGVPLHFATVTERRGDSIGLLVTSHEGRPTKVEGNPEHRSSGGATDIWAQASLLDLYDPDRSKGPARREGGGFVEPGADVKESYRALDEALQDRLRDHQRDQGDGLRLLLPPTNSPSMIRLRRAIQERYPKAQFHVYAPVHEGNARAGARLAFNQPLNSVYQLDQARVILALDSDFLVTETGATRHARGFAAGRAPRDATQDMNRLYVVEPGHSTTGSTADHRLRLPASRIGDYLRALGRTLATRHGLDLGPILGSLGELRTEGIPSEWLEAVATDLAEHPGRAPILVGSRQPPEVHALAHALNAALNNVGRSLLYYPVADPDEPDVLRSLAELTAAANAGSVRTLLILGGNPVQNAPADLRFDKALEKVEWSMHLAMHRDETSAHTTWHANAAHELESWGDQRALDGTWAVQQPLIQPLWGGRSPLEMLGLVAGQRAWRGHGLVRETLRSELPSASNFEATWRQSLHAGVAPVGNPADVPPVPALQGTAVAQALGARPRPARIDEQALELVFAPCSKLFDGRYANNPWLLEVPDAMTKLSWDNAALVSAATARALNVQDGDFLKIERDGAAVTLPVVALPGHADWSVTLTLGWGRGKIAGRYAEKGEYEGGGFSVHPLRSSDAFWFGTGAKVTKAGGHYFLAETQEHDRMEGRPLVADATLDEYRARPDFAAYEAVDMTQEPLVEGRPPPGGPLWEAVDYKEGHRWGMSIDLSSCVGCNACVVACQAENNVPSVGKRQIARGREMYWLRIDRYFSGDDDDPEVAVQPVGCQQCEEAPCENVCPVNATTHSPEGLNDMAYNRCIGTRYCANNCPYKVRRFNYLSWHGYLDDQRSDYAEIPEVKKMQYNPNVTVRMRGVMEKCTYCVQRIQSAKITARREDRKLADGDITTACAQACSAQAIVFGDLNDPKSRVAQKVKADRNYRLLAELGTRPRTNYLAKIRNPNPAMQSVPRAADEPSADVREGS